MSFEFFLIMTILFWGLAPIFGKIGVASIDPLAGLAIRTFVVGIILIIICFATNKFGEIANTDLKTMTFIGLEGIFASLLGHFAYYYTLKLGDVSKAMPIVVSYPIITVIAAGLILGEKLTWNKIVGIIVIVFGVFLVKR